MILKDMFFLLTIMLLKLTVPFQTLLSMQELVYHLQHLPGRPVKSVQSVPRPSLPVM